MQEYEQFDAVVVGGGPAGATAATDLARRGHRVLLLERGGRIKPCGGAVPPRLIEEFAIPQELLVARIRSARMVSACAGKALQRTVSIPFLASSRARVVSKIFIACLQSRVRVRLDVGFGEVR